MKNLPDVTLVAITTRDFGTTVTALKKSIQQIKPHSVLFFSNIKFEDPDYECIVIPKFKNWEEYNEFVCKELWRYITTSHVLLVQHDGHVLDGSVWTDEFLEYDYIGAPWTYKDGRNVGNGGFSMRSKRLMHIMATDEFITSQGIYSPEDEVICRLYRKYLEQIHNVSFAPEELAHQFAYEMHPPKHPTFGFHNHFHEPFKEFIILKRSCAMGDIIMMEPVMEHLHNKGYRVVLDCPAEYFHVFQYHHYPLLHISQLGHVDGIQVINMDMSYESMPKQLALKSYYQTCGIEHGVLRNSKLNFPVDATTKLFEKYIVMHMDDTDMPYRNVHGVDWEDIACYLQSLGYTVIQVGGEHKAGLKMNTPTKNMLMYLMAGADFFIGQDSGPSQVAVALGIPSIIFFGSVNPEYRYPDLSKIRIIQNHCDKAGCYHSVIGVRGTDCVYDKENPPCCTYQEGSEEVKYRIHHHIHSLKSSK